MSNTNNANKHILVCATCMNASGVGKKVVDTFRRSVTLDRFLGNREFREYYESRRTYGGKRAIDRHQTQKVILDILLFVRHEGNEARGRWVSRGAILDMFVPYSRRRGKVTKGDYTILERKSPNAIDRSEESLKASHLEVELPRKYERAPMHFVPEEGPGSGRSRRVKALRHPTTLDRLLNDLERTGIIEAKREVIRKKRSSDGKRKTSTYYRIPRKHYIGDPDRFDVQPSDNQVKKIGRRYHELDAAKELLKKYGCRNPQKAIEKYLRKRAVESTWFEDDDAD